MSRIEFHNVTLDYPIYSCNNMSLRSSLLNATTGGIVHKQRNQVDVVRALDDINLIIKQGDKVGLLGHNGSGKSTLLRTMAQIFIPSQGTVKVRGSISTLFDLGAGIDPELTGLENSIRVLMLHGLRINEAPQPNR